MSIGVDWFKAKSMSGLSLNHRIRTMSEEMKELFDEIYVLSRKGEFSVEVKNIDKDDVKLLNALGYNVKEKWIPTKLISDIDELPVYERAVKYIVSWH